MNKNTDRQSTKTNINWLITINLNPSINPYK